MNNKLYSQVKADLLEQLRLKGADTPTLINLVEDYMKLWKMKELLAEDVAKNGVRLPYDNGGGQRGFKENPSVKLQLNVNAQMLKILAQLKISTDNIALEDDEL